MSMDSFAAWQVVFGDRQPKEVVAEFDLTDSSPRAIDEWVRKCAAEAVLQADPEERAALSARLKPFLPWLGEELAKGFGEA